MSKEESVVKYYLLCNKLKDIIRSGWIYFNVNRKRIESIAEHIYGVQMLALAMKSEYQYDIDINKVLYMLAIHELGEITIGDLMPIDIADQDKKVIEHKAVHNILSSLIDGDRIEQLFLEFDAHETPEAKFAYQCDKLESDIQCKLYDQKNPVDLSSINEKAFVDGKKNNKSWSEIWIDIHQKKYSYDENFLRVSNYIKENKIDD